MFVKLALHLKMLLVNKIYILHDKPILLADFYKYEVQETKGI